MGERKEEPTPQPTFVLDERHRAHHGGPGVVGWSLLCGCVGGGRRVWREEEWHSKLRFPQKRLPPFFFVPCRPSFAPLCSPTPTPTPPLPLKPIAPHSAQAAVASTGVPTTSNGESAPCFFPPPLAHVLYPPQFPFTRPPHPTHPHSTQSQVEETIERIKNKPGVEGYVFPKNVPALVVLTHSTPLLPPPPKK